MRKWKKALSCVLTFALCIPALATTAFGLYEPASSTGAGWKQFFTYTEEELTKFVPLLFEVGNNQTATATGYAQFYDTCSENSTKCAEAGIFHSCNSPNDLRQYHRTGRIKFVIHDGVMVVTNELTKEETDALGREMAYKWKDLFGSTAPVTEYDFKQSAAELRTANFLSSSPAGGQATTPIQKNPNIETVIFGDNVTGVLSNGVFWKCPNLKNVIWVDGGDGGIVYSNTPIETVIFNASGDEEMAVTGTDYWGNEYRSSLSKKAMDRGCKNFADMTAYDTPTGGWGATQYLYKPNTKGSIVVGWEPDYDYDPGIDTDSVYGKRGDVAAQQAEAKALIADMNLPDWALAFLPTEVGGTEQVRTVDEVFDFYTGEMLSDWGGTSQSENETPAVTQPAYTTDNPKVDAWASDFYKQAKGFGLLPTDGVLGSDYTAKITRAQFAALAVTTYEKSLDTTVPVSAGDDAFADCTGNEYVAKAYNLGILSGYNSAATRAGVSVGPNDLITREQAAVMLARMMTKYNDATGGVQPAKAESLPFKDTASSWALDGIATVYEHGIMVGTSATTFDGKANYTIEQAIVTMYRFYDWTGRGVSI